jgi:acyl carrier protein
MSTKAEVTRIIVHQLGVEAGLVVDGASFIDDLGADSLAIVELVLAFEEHFGITIPEEAAGNIATVADAVAYIDEHLPAPRADSTGAAGAHP